MLRPTPGELLRAVRDGLADQVLPSLPDGTARRQLKAALHILARLERTWDLQHSYLEADNADLTATLREVLGRPDLPASPVEFPGVNDPALVALMTTNHALQELLATADPNHPALPALHRRMTARALAAS